MRITDKILWDIYNAIGEVGDIFYFLTKQPTAANYLMGPKNPVFEKYKKDIGEKRFNRLVHYLRKNNYIKSENLRGNKAIIITKKGLNKVLRASFEAEKKIKRKDRKWIMLIFDIPERYKKSRNLMVSILHNLEYKMFQQSVWVTPFDVSEKTEKLLQFYSLDRFVKIFLIEKL
ncbi:MAG: hypothetical protein AAB340_01550 [Patescibacteria group bacterium]